MDPQNTDYQPGQSQPPVPSNSPPNDYGGLAVLPQMEFPEGFDEPEPAPEPDMAALGLALPMPPLYQPSTYQPQVPRYQPAPPPYQPPARPQVQPQQPPFQPQPRYQRPVQPGQPGQQAPNPYSNPNPYIGPYTQPYRQPIQPMPHMSQAPYQQLPQAQPFPPPAQQNPYNNAYNFPGQAKSRKGLKIFLVILLAVILGGSAAAGVYWQKMQANTPDAVFKDAMADALSTNSVTQVQTAPTLGDAVINYDVQDIKKPRLSITSNAVMFSNSLQMDGYSTLADTYLRIKTTASDITASELSPLNDKWIHTRINGTQTEKADAYTALLSDPFESFFGDFIFGNFSQTDQKNLTDYLINNHVYTYDANKVRTEQFNGAAVYVYEVKVNLEKLKEFNKKAAAAMGIEAKRLDRVLAGLQLSESKMYIEKASRHLVKVDTKVDGQSVVNEYRNFNATEVSGPPQSAFTVEEIDKLLETTQPSATSPGGTTPRSTPTPVPTPSPAPGASI